MKTTFIKSPSTPFQNNQSLALIILQVFEFETARLEQIDLFAKSRRPGLNNMSILLQREGIGIPDSQGTSV